MTKTSAPLLTVGLALFQRPLRALRSSIVLRLSLVAGLIVVACFAIFSLLVATSTQSELEQQISAQQFSTAVVMADIINQDFAERLRALQQAATQVDTDQVASDPMSLERLGSAASLSRLFNGGLAFAGTDGVVAASIPSNHPRVGKSYLDRPFVQAALAGQSVVSDPVIGKQLQAAIIVIAVPVREGDGPVVGVLLGTIDLSQPSFLDRVTLSKYGKTGGFTLVSPKTRTIVTATDRRLVMKPVAEKDPTVQRFLAGFEGSGVLTNSAGVTLLASAKSIPTTGWYIAASLPVEEAYGTLKTLQQRLNFSGLALLVVSLVGAWLAIRHAMAPLQRAARLVELHQRAGEPLQVLPAGQPDEAGTLITGFNQMLDHLHQKEVALRDSELRYRSLVHALHVGVVVHAPDASITLSNRRAQELLGLSADQLSGKTSMDPDWNVIREDGSPFPGNLHPAMQALSTLHRIEGVVMGVYRPGQGDRIWLLVTAEPRQDDSGRLSEVVVTFNDISPQMQTKEALRRSEAFGQSVLDSLGENVAVLDQEANIVAVNQSWKEFSIANGGDPCGACGVGSNYLNVCRPVIEGSEAEDAEQTSTGIREVMQGRRSLFEYEYPCHAPHQRRWFRMGVTPMRGGKGGVVISHLNITEHKLAEFALQQANQEKVALLKEVHHRVKNNLQVITSLLRMESRRSKAPEAVDVLKAMQTRIRAMSQLHESLYRSGTFASVDLGTYLGQIATQTFHTHLLDGKMVQLKLNMGSVPAGMDLAIACGLLVNELVSNCLKHGFPDGRAGEVRVHLQPADPDTVQTDALWHLQVSDNGAGLPPDFEDKRKTSLGLQLAGDLSQQAGGKLAIASPADGGAVFSVVFKVQAPAPLVMPL